MEYQALYRKYRPQRFAEVVGQDHVVGTLSREIVESKVAHAYLFAGPRGTGKTTSARLLAKALNCPDRRPDGEPCAVCTSCLAIADGTSLDVIELDAASHNKVEDIREIRMNVGTVAAVGGARRVYILDEAHMLSRAAGNALLKTLEEPPEHVVFVLATTEPYKLLDTIRSRAQRFDFHPVPEEVLRDYMRDVAASEGFEAEPDGLAMVAGHANGSVRDAISLLEQVAALGGGKVQASLVSRALGLADKDAYTGLAAAIADHNAPAALGLVAELASRGADLRRFVAEALGFFRGVFLAQYAPNLEEVADEPLDTLEDWRRVAGSLPAADVLRAVDQLGQALLDLRQGREERLVVELALLRLTRPETAVDAAGLDSRLSRLEGQVRDVLQTRAASAPPPPEEPLADDAPRAPSHLRAVPVEPPAEDPAGGDAQLSRQPVAVVAPTAAPAAAPAAEGLDLATFSVAWPAIVAAIRDRAGPRRHAFLKAATPVAVTGARVTFEVPAHLHFHLEQLREDHELHRIVSDVAVEMVGGSVDVVFTEGGESPAKPGAGAAADDDLDEPVPDKEQLMEAGEGRGTDPASLVEDILGGEIVSE
jgi:DNA polymerase-3 subunit gamma/tau